MIEAYKIASSEIGKNMLIPIPAEKGIMKRTKGI